MEPKKSTSNYNFSEHVYGKRYMVIGWVAGCGGLVACIAEFRRFRRGADTEMMTRVRIGRALICLTEHDASTHHLT